MRRMAAHTRPKRTRPMPRLARPMSVVTEPTTRAAMAIPLADAR